MRLKNNYKIRRYFIKLKKNVIFLINDRPILRVFKKWRNNKYKTEMKVQNGTSLQNENTSFT